MHAILSKTWNTLQSRFITPRAHAQQGLSDRVGVHMYICIYIYVYNKIAKSGPECDVRATRLSKTAKKPPCFRRQLEIVGFLLITRWT